MINVTFVFLSPNLTEFYNINITCAIHPNSTAKWCEVIVVTASGTVAGRGNDNI